MLHRLKKSLRMGWFNSNTRAVLGTRPATCEPRAGFVLLSQVCHADLQMYLLAVKSFTRYLRPSEIIMLDDGSLTAADRNVLSKHIEGGRLVPLHQIPNAVAPHGQFWGRLLAAVDAAQSNYVIQLDSDTLTLQDVQEVRHQVATSRGFTLGTRSGERFVSMSEAAEFGQRRLAEGSKHIQHVAEARFGRLPGYEKLRYVRGCAAFAGYAPGSVCRAQVEWFSDRLVTLTGEARFTEWGTDQLASNYLVANARCSAVLPLPKYATHEPDVDLRGTVFVHFIGAHRFRWGTYLRWSRTVIGQLQRDR